MKQILRYTCTMILLVIAHGLLAQGRINLQINFDGSTGESDCTHCYNINAKAKASSTNSSISWVETGEMDQKRGCCIFTNCDYTLHFNRGLINQDLNFFPSTISVGVQEYAAFSVIGCTGNSTSGTAAESNTIITSSFANNTWESATVSNGNWRDVGGYKFGVKINIPQVSTFTTYTQNSNGNLVPLDRFCEGQTVHLTTGYQNNLLRDARFEWRYSINNSGSYTYFFTDNDTGTGSFVLPAGFAPTGASRVQLQVRLKGPDVTIPAFSFGGFTFGPFVYAGMAGPWSHVQELIVYPQPPALNLAGLDPARALQVASDINEGNNSVRVEHVTCQGGNNGKIRINNIGGAGNYFITVKQISSGSVMNYFSGGQPSTAEPILLPDSAIVHHYNSNSPFEFSAGRYEVVLSHYTVLPNGEVLVLGCFSSQELVIKQPEIFETNISKVKYNNNLDVSCREDNLTGEISEDGRITVQGIKGIGPYSYTLRGYTGSNKDVEVPSLMQTGSGAAAFTFSRLKAVEGGDRIYYKVTATDALGCMANDRSEADHQFTHEYTSGATSPSLDEELFMVVPEPLDISHFKNNYYGYDIECFSGVDQVASYATGGSEVFDLWIEGGSLSSNQLKSGIAGSTPVDFTGLAAGGYHIKIRDSNGCLAETPITLSQPDKLVFELGEIIKPECFGSSTGAIRLNATGGVPVTAGAFDYTYSLSHDAPPPPNVWPENFDPQPADQTVDESFFENLISGTYTATITDRSGCQQSYPYTITEPTPIAAAVDQNEIICYGESTGYAEATISGGTAPYIISWLDNGKNIIATESLNSPGEMSELTDQAGGQYYLRVKDSNQCIREDILVISQPSGSLDIVANPQDVQPVSCHGLDNGQVVLQVTGGWQPYLVGKSKTNLRLNAFSYTGLAAGTQRFYVRDFKGCMDSVDVVITEPDVLEVTGTGITAVSCFGESDGAFVPQITGGTAPYEILIPALGWLPSGPVSALPAGDHDLKVRDANGCQADFSVTIDTPDALGTTLLSSTDTRCGESTGTATIGVVGGTAPYNTQWTFEDQVITTGVTASDLAAGIYNVSVSDANGCSVRRNVGISDSNGPVVSIDDVVPVKCFGESNGEANISVTGGASPYSVLWSGEQTGLTVAGLNAGEHFANVTDQEGCSTVAKIEVPGPEPLQGTFTDIVNPFCFGDSNGSLRIAASGGTAPYTYNWVEIAGFDSQVSNVDAGTYTVRITDYNQCILETSYDLQQPNPVDVNLGGVAFLCTGQTMTLDAGNPGATYQWQSSTGYFSTDRTVEVNSSGEYTVIVTDLNGCQGSDTFELVVDPNILRGDFLATTEAVAGDTVVLVNISFPLPDSAYWKLPPDAVLHESSPFDQKVIFAEAGIYPVTLFVNKGDCFDEITKQIAVAERPENSGRQNTNTPRLITDFKIFPNPSDGRFSVEVLLREDASIHLEVYGLDGYRSWGSYKGMAKDRYEVDVDISEAPSGMYTVFLKAGNENVAKRIVIY